MKYELKEIEGYNVDYAQKLGELWLPPGYSERRKMVIEELPFMITDNGTIVCIPKLPEMGLIAIVGMTGMGKTMVAGILINNIFYSWGDNVGIINDSQEETFSWSEENNVDEFVEKFRKINQFPIPLPLVYLFPNSEDFDIDEEIIREKEHITISIPFEDVIQNIENYLPNLGGSLKYFEEKKEELLEIQTEEGLFDVINSIEYFKGSEEVKRKLGAVFKNLIREGILNISDPTIPSSLIIEDKLTGKEIYNGNPMTSIMLCDCIPSFITSDLYTEKYKDLVFSYYLNKMFKESSNGAMKGKRVWIYFDELTRVVHSNPSYSSPKTQRALVEISTRGRNNGISLMYATQMYNDIPREIRSQTKFAIVFRHNSKDKVKEITDDFSIKDMKESILNLKKFECIAATTEHFICYKGKKRWKEYSAMKGMIIPPLHKNSFLHKKGGRRE